MTFRIGQRVRCVRAAPKGDLGLVLLVEGQVYTVSEVDRPKSREVRDWLDADYGVGLEGIDLLLFDADRFEAVDK